MKGPRRGPPEKTERNAEIIRLFRAGMKQADLAKKFRVSMGVISKITARGGRTGYFEEGAQQQ